MLAVEATKTFLGVAVGVKNAYDIIDHKNTPTSLDTT